MARLARITLVAASVSMTGCVTGLTETDHSKKPKTQIEAAEVSISASPALQFGLVRSRLKPNDPAKSASEYRKASVERSLAIIEQQLVSTGGGLNVNLPGTATTKESVSGSSSSTTDGVTTQDSSSSDTRTRTLSPGERPSVDVSSPDFSTDLALASFAAGLDLELAFEAADFLYQRAKLNDAYYDVNFARPGMDAWVVKIHLTVQPLVRDMPYDIRARLDFTSSEDANVQLVPLFATGNFEASSYQNLASQLQQLNLNLTALTGGTGLSAGLERRVQEVLERIGSDINTKVSVGVDGPDTVKVSLPAAFSARSEYELRDQTYTITLLAFVDSNACSGRDGTQELKVSANWTMIDATTTGRQVPVVNRGDARRLSYQIDHTPFYLEEFIQPSNRMAGLVTLINDELLDPNAQHWSLGRYANVLKELSQSMRQFDSAYAELAGQSLSFVDHRIMDRALANLDLYSNPKLSDDNRTAIGTTTLNELNAYWAQVESAAQNRIGLLSAEPEQLTALEQQIRQARWYRNGIENLRYSDFATLEALGTFQQKAARVFEPGAVRAIRSVLHDVSQPNVGIPLNKSPRLLPNFQFAELVDDGKSVSVATISGIKAIAQDEFSARIYATENDVGSLNGRELCVAIESVEGFGLNDDRANLAKTALKTTGKLVGPYYSRSTSLSGSTLKLNFPSLTAIGQMAGNKPNDHRLIMRVDTEQESCPVGDGGSISTSAWLTSCYLVSKNFASSGEVAPAFLAFDAKLLSDKLALTPSAAGAAGTQATAVLTIQGKAGVASPPQQYKVTVQNGTVRPVASAVVATHGTLQSRTAKLMSENAFITTIDSVLEIDIDDLASKDTVKFKIEPVDPATGKPLPSLASSELTATIR